MIEANENIDLVTMRRQQEMRQAQESYQKAVSEGRLEVKPRTVETAEGWGQPALTQPSQPVATEAQPVEAVPPPADPEVAWRHTRLAITAGIVVLLLVVWIWQKKAGR